MTDTQPIGAFRFALEIDGIELASFAKAEGLGLSTEAFEIREGGVNTHTHKRVGRYVHQPVVLARLVDASPDLSTWREACLGAVDPVRKGAAVILYDAAGEVVVRFELDQAWPVRWSGPDLDTDGSDGAIETIEIVHEGVRRA